MIKFLIIVLILYYIFVYKDQIQPRKQESRSSAGNRPTPYTDPGDPFSVLGINRSSSNEEIKAAYRELSKKNHPDLVAHMSEDFQKMAEEKLKKINWAFSEIKKQRGL